MNFNLELTTNCILIVFKHFNRVLLTVNILSSERKLKQSLVNIKIHKNWII